MQTLLSKDGITVCASAALRWRQQLDWTSKGTSYCQMIQEVNKEKRPAWAIKNKDMFWEDVIFTDKTTVRIETHQKPAVTRKDKSLGTSLSPSIPSKSTFGQESALEARHHCALL